MFYHQQKYPEIPKTPSKLSLSRHETGKKRRNPPEPNDFFALLSRHLKGIGTSTAREVAISATELGESFPRGVEEVSSLSLGTAFDSRNLCAYAGPDNSPSLHQVSPVEKPKSLHPRGLQTCSWGHHSGCCLGSSFKQL